MTEDKGTADQGGPPYRWDDWRRWVEDADWSDWRSWLRRVASADWATGPLAGTPWERAPRPAHFPHRAGWEEDGPGTRSLSTWLRPGLPSGDGGDEGANTRPDAAEARTRLEETCPSSSPRGSG